MDSNHSRNGGFGIPDIIATVALLSVVGGIAGTAFSSANQRARDAKLHSQTHELNRAVQLFHNAGGSLVNAATIPDVMERLQALPSTEIQQRIAGYSGNFLSPNIQAILQTPEESHSDEPRILWDATNASFHLANTGGIGIKAMVMEEITHLPPQVAESPRSTFMELAIEDGWIWDYEDEAPDHENEGTSQPGGDGLDPTPDYESTQQLQPPSITPGSLTALVSAFPMTISVANPNPENTSALYYSINSSEWTLLPGTEVQVPPDATLSVFAKSLDPEAYYNSFVVSEQYTAESVALSPPTIALSQPILHVHDIPQSEITISHENDPAVAKIVYAINGSSWIDYSGPVLANLEHYPGGATIWAKAISYEDQPHYTESTIDDAVITVQLAPPDFSIPSSTCCEAEFDKELVLSNPNLGDVSRILYQLNDDGWLEYDDPISVPADTEVSAYCVSSTTRVYDSEIISHTYESMPLLNLNLALIYPFSGSRFMRSTTVSITATRQLPFGTRIAYTLDGSEPSLGPTGELLNGIPYDGAFELVNDSAEPKVYELATKIFPPLKDLGCFQVDSTTTTNIIIDPAVTLEPPHISPGDTNIAGGAMVQITPGSNAPLGARVVYDLEHSVIEGALPDATVQTPYAAPFPILHLPFSPEPRPVRVRARMLAPLGMEDNYHASDVVEMVYHIQPAQKLEPPVISFTGNSDATGSFIGGVTIENVINTQDLVEGTRIFYTLDGSDPGISDSQQPTGGLELVENLEIHRFHAGDDQLLLSLVARAYPPPGDLAHLPSDVAVYAFRLGELDLDLSNGPLDLSEGISGSLLGNNLEGVSILSPVEDLDENPFALGDLDIADPLPFTGGTGLSL